MMIANTFQRCSYYLVLTLSLGLHGIAQAAENPAATSPAKVTEPDAPKTNKSADKPKDKPKPTAPEKATPAAAIAPIESAKTVSPVVEPGKAAAETTTTSPAPAAEKVSPATISQGPIVGEHGEVCPPVPAPAPEMERSETYKGMPFQPGEEARYILKYGLLKVHVGYGFLRTLPPTKYTMPVGRSKEGLVLQEGRWHRVLSAEAYTGDWYKMIFAGHDKMQAFSRPWDFGVTKFYISQNEEKPFVRRFHAEKWLDFDHVSCSVHERMVDHKKKKETIAEHFLQPAAIDALGALYKLRTYAWELKKTERILVYTSEKNWWLEATPIEVENLKTAVGSFRAFKLEVKTYLGKELQQKGKLFIWVAADHPNHPMLRVEGKVTFGSIYLELDQYKVGEG